MNARRAIFPDASQAALACSARIGGILSAAIARSGFASLAISGGSSPKPVFEDLARQPLDWGRAHLFWVDERAVPPDDPQSNYGMARRMLIDPAGIPSENVHRIAGELPPAEAARRYIEEIRTVFRLSDQQIPEFDVIHCGIGADGHTASLFPGDPLIEDRENLAAAVHVPKMNQWRVTLLAAPLLAARNLVVYSTGGDKREIIADIVNGAFDPRRLPAQLIAREAKQADWFLDVPAAGLLGAPPMHATPE